MQKYKIGDQFTIGNEQYILALTTSYKDVKNHRFQLIGIKSGNRWSDVVVLHTKGVFSRIEIDENELRYLLTNELRYLLTMENDEIQIQDIIASHIKGANWRDGS